MRTWIFLACIFMVSCASLTLDRASGLRKGMTKQNVNSVVAIEPKANINLDDSISVEVYDMSSGSYKSDYYISYKHNKLVYWGYPHEYGREKDPLLNRIAKEATEKLSAMKLK